MSRHYPPAYYKYKKTHTTVSIYVTKEFKKELDRRRGNLTYSTFLKRLTSDLDGQVDRRVHEKWSEIEKNVRQNKDNFRTPCAHCGKLIYLSSLDYNWSKIKEVLYQAFEGWYHGACLKEMEKEEKARSKSVA